MSEHRQTTLGGEQVKVPDGHVLRRVPLFSGVVAVAALAGAVGIGDWPSFFRAYHVVFVFLLSFAIGGMFFTLLHHVANARWSVTTRRIAENMMGTFPLLFVLFIPIAFLGLDDIFLWADQQAVDALPATERHLVEHKQAFLNAGFFQIRACIYLLIWNVIAWFFGRGSVQQDQSGDPELTGRLSRFAPIALVLFGLTLTGASFDWVMSVDPRWFSTVFGVYYFSGCVVAGYAAIVIIAVVLRKNGLGEGVITTEHLHDLGKMLFAFVVFWAYIAFSQYMLYWYANIPEETVWYRDRWAGSWSVVTVALAVGHFVVPFFFLLSRHIKRHQGLLVAAASWMVAMHLLDVYWLIMPAPYPTGARFGLVEVLVLLGLGGLWVAYLARLVVRRAIIPVQDPRLAESLAFENV